MTKLEKFLERFNAGELLTVEDVARNFAWTESQARYQLKKLVKKRRALVSRQTVIDERGWYPETKTINFYWKKEFGEQQFFPTIL